MRSHDSSSWGCSRRHGPQYSFQKFTTSAFPRYADGENVPPCNVGPPMAGTGPDAGTTPTVGCEPEEHAAARRSSTIEVDLRTRGTLSDARGEESEPASERSPPTTSECCV